MKKPKNKNTKAYQIWLQRKERKDNLKTWRQLALHRAGYRCEYCGCEGEKGRGKALNVHHIIGQRCKELLTNLHNAIVLCPDCHKFLIGLAGHENPIRLAIWLMEERPISWEYLREWTENFLLKWERGRKVEKRAFNKKEREKLIDLQELGIKVYHPEFQDSTGDG